MSDQQPEAPAAEDHLRDARERLREAAATLRRMLDGQGPPGDVLDRTGR